MILKIKIDKMDLDHVLELSKYLQQYGNHLIKIYVKDDDTKPFGVIDSIGFNEIIQ